MRVLQCKPTRIFGEIHQKIFKFESILKQITGHSLEQANIVQFGQQVEYFREYGRMEDTVMLSIATSLDGYLWS